MIRSCVTISLVEEARGGPFVFWHNLAESCRQARALGFDAVEIFAPSAREFDRSLLRTLISETGLAVAAFGTGAGWLRQHLTLTGGETSERLRAQAFIREMIDLAAEFNAAAIIGSMQGRWGGNTTRERALGCLAEGLAVLTRHAQAAGQMLLYEPLNRYETNLINQLDEATAFVGQIGEPKLKLLADLFHMNIEEVNLAAALRNAGASIGHVHFVDSNRRPAGAGHIAFRPIAEALGQIGYKGYVSAEACAWPDSDSAARQTIRTYREHFPQQTPSL